VDYYVSTTGSDANPGTLAQPFRTIQKGSDTAQAGDNVLIMAGTYFENVVVSNSGTDYDNMISYFSYGGGEVIVDGTIGLVFWVQLGADYIRIEGLTLINGHEGSFNGAGIRSEGDFGIFNYNVFRFNKHGVYLSGQYDPELQMWSGSTGNEIAYNVMYDNEASGIWIKHSDYGKIHHNIIYHNTTLWEKGALTYYGGIGLEIYNNTLYDNVHVGIYNYNGNDPSPSSYDKTFNNLVVVSPDSVAFKVDEMMVDDPTVEYHHNLWYSESGNPRFAWGYDEYQNGGQTLTYPEFIQLAAQVNGINGYGDILDDPRLADPANQNFNLVWESPAIDAGVADPEFMDPDGTRADLGALYYDQSGNGEILVTVAALNPPVVIPSGGGSFNYQVTLENLSGIPLTLDAWVDVTLPVGGHFGPLITPRSLTLQPGETLSRQLTQNVPSGAPAGEYHLNVYAGEIEPVQFFGSGRFTFEKIDASLDGNPALNWSVSGDFNQEDDTGTSAMPSVPILKGAYPNPFNPSTKISFVLPEASQVRLHVYDVSGRLVRTLLEGWQDAGAHEVIFEASGLVSGVYVYSLHLNGHTLNEKIVLMR
jgi:parallel beta-helix repeat protein